MDTSADNADNDIDDDALMTLLTMQKEKQGAAKGARGYQVKGNSSKLRYVAYRLA